MFRQGSRPSSYEQAAYQTMIYEKYHYIEKVASLRSISKAAQELYISQPALTRIISSVEKELGIMLFNRSVLPLQLTYAGERFLEEARRILDLDAALQKELQEISEAKRGHLSIGANYAANALWLPHILPVFRREYPGISISIFQQSSPLFEKELLKGDIDLAFTTQSAPSKSLSYVYLSSALLLVFIPNTSPILRGRDISHNSLDCPLTVSPEELNHQDFVLLHPSDGLGHTISALLEENRIRPSHILYAPNIVACYRLAAAGMGITFATPYSTRYTLPGAVPVIAQLSTGTVYEQNAIAYPKDKQLSTSEERFIELSRQKVSTHPLLQPLSTAQWDSLRSASPGLEMESNYF